MIEISGWRIEKEKVVLSLIKDGRETFDVTLSDDYYEEIIKDGPPSAGKRTRELLKKIHDIKKNRLMIIENVVKAQMKLLGEIDDARIALKKADSNLIINKWKAVLSACAREKITLQEFRHLIKLTYQEQAEAQILLHTGKD